jgi:hypothetical protein
MKLTDTHPKKCHLWRIFRGWANNWLSNTYPRQRTPRAFFIFHFHFRIISSSSVCVCVIPRVLRTRRQRKFVAYFDRPLRIKTCGLKLSYSPKVKAACVFFFVNSNEQSCCLGWRKCCANFGRRRAAHVSEMREEQEHAREEHSFFCYMFASEIGFFSAIRTQRCTARWWYLSCIFVNHRENAIKWTTVVTHLTGKCWKLVFQKHHTYFFVFRNAVGKGLITIIVWTTKFFA